VKKNGNKKNKKDDEYGKNEKDKKGEDKKANTTKVIGPFLNCNTSLLFYIYFLHRKDKYKGSKGWTGNFFILKKKQKFEYLFS
jgi:hypothetical protein